jgi:hypothetical protein
MKFIRYAIFILITLVWTAKIFGYEVCTTNSGKYIKWLYPNATYLINDSDGQQLQNLFFTMVELQQVQLMA